MYWSICREVNSIAKTMKHMPDELRGLDKILADKYFCNFSLFQSLPHCARLPTSTYSCTS